MEFADCRKFGVKTQDTKNSLLQSRSLMIFIFLIFLGGLARAEIIKTAVCYGYQPKKESERYFSFLLQSYYDTTLSREVGAFVQYNKNDYIPLIFDAKVETDQDEPALGNFELRRLEVIKGKITGEYTVIRTGAGIKQGEYLEYKNYSSKKKYIFFETKGGVDACIEECKNGKCKFQSISK